MTSFSINQQDEYIPYKEGLLLFNQQSIRYVDRKASTLWDTKINLSDCKISVSDKIIAVYNELKCQVYNTAGKLIFEKESSSPILSVRTGNNYFIIQTMNSNNIPFLTIYDTNGKVIDEIKFPDQAIVDYGFYGSQDMLWVINLDNRGTVPVSIISTYNPGKSITGIISVNDQIIYRVLFSQDTMIAVGTRSILCYNYMGEQISEQSVYGWTLLQQNAGNPTKMLFVPAQSLDEGQDRAFSSIRVISMDGTELSLTLPFESYSAYVTQQSVYCFSNRSIFYYNIKNGKKEKTNFPFAVDKVKASDDGKGFFFLRGNTIYFYPIDK